MYPVLVTEENLLVLKNESREGDELESDLKLTRANLSKSI